MPTFVTGVPVPATPTPRPNARRPAMLTAVTAMLVFLGVTAVGGGIEMLLYRNGNSFLPKAWLDGIPLIDSWLAPGLVLGLGFGVGSLVTAYGLLRRPRWRLTGPVERLTGRHWSWAASVLLGIGLSAWIALEMIYLPARSWLEVLYGVLGVVLATVPWHPRVRTHLRTGGPS